VAATFSRRLRTDGTALFSFRFRIDGTTSSFSFQLAALQSFGFVARQRPGLMARNLSFVAKHGPVLLAGNLSFPARQGPGLIAGAVPVPWLLHIPRPPGRGTALEALELRVIPSHEPATTRLVAVVVDDRFFPVDIAV
jgi:hypothetical protein